MKERNMRSRIWIIVIVVLAALGTGGFLFVRSKNQASQQTNYQTATVQNGSIKQEVSSSGSVRSNKSAQVDWQTSGQVGTLDVQVGQSVQAGQKLAELDNNTVSSSVLNAQQTLLDAQNNLQTLQNSTLTISQAQQALANAQDAYNKAQASLSALRRKTNADATTIKQYQADLELARLQLQKMEEKYGKLDKIKPTNRVKANKVLAMTQAEQKVQTAERNLNWAEGHATSTELAVAQGNLAVAKSQLDDAQRTYDQVKNGIQPDKIAAAQAAVEAAQATVNEINLTAPISGTVTEVETLPGSVVTAGTVGARIDDLSSMYVDVVVSEVDVNKIKSGQPVELTFTAVPNKTYSGKVTLVGDVGTSTSGVVNFPVTVQITDADSQVKPGMSAIVNIIVAQDNNVLLVPNQAVQTLGGRSVVTVLYQGQLIQVPVTVGLTNNTTSEVASNQLKAGDTVVLNSTVSSSTSGSSFGGRGGAPFRRGIP
jgi:HlyD family secretion protein